MDAESEQKQIALKAKALGVDEKQLAEERGRLLEKMKQIRQRSLSKGKATTKETKKEEDEEPKKKQEKPEKI